MRHQKRISVSFLLPSAVFDQHIILLGKTRSGKSSVMRLMIEHLLEKGEPICIVDPKGDWWGLKASATGKQAGFPVVIFGGEHGDVPLNSRSGAAVAELTAIGNRPCIIDLGGWMPGARTEFWIDFASKFFILHRGRRWLAVDEIHNFCPKGKLMDPQAAKMLHWSNRLASEGLGKGISLIAASQRPQKVHNDFLTSCETLCAMRVIHKADRDALNDWIEGCGDVEIGDAEAIKLCKKETDHAQVGETGFCRCRKRMHVVESLASMKRGEAWVWSPEAGFGPKRIQFPMFSTYDSFKPQKAVGSVKLKGWADVDLAEVTKKLEVAVKEAEANDPKKLQAKIRELQAALIKADKQKLPPIVNEKLTRPVKASAAEIRRVLQAEVEPWKKFGQDIRRRLVNTTQLLKEIGKACGDLANKTAMPSPHEPIPDYPVLHPDFKILKAEVVDHGDQHVHHGTIATHRTETRPHPAQHGQARTAPAVDSGTWHGEDLPQGQKEVLIAIARYQEGVERNQLTVLTGYKRSTRDAYIARLKPKGLIEIRGDRITATEAGITALGTDHTPQPATGEELQQYWMSELPTGEKKILEILIAEHGRPVEREKLDEQGFARSSRDAYLSRLAAKRLVEPIGRGQVRASPALFA
jgi:hypothetical protein